MIIFSIFFLFVLNFLKKMKNKSVYLILGLIPIFIGLGFQEAIGTDYYAYIRIFRSEFDFPYSRGFLFKILVNVLNFFYFSERSLFVTIALIQVILIYNIVVYLYKNRYIEDSYLYLLIMLISTGFYGNMLNALRSSIASLFVQLAILYLIDNKNKKYFFLILLGAIFHPSAIIWCCLFFIKKYFFIKINNKKIIILFIVSLYLKNIQVIKKLANYIYNLDMDIPYKFYLVSRHMNVYVNTYGIATIINLILCICSLYFYSKEKNKNKIFMYNMGYILNSFILIFSTTPIFYRLLEPKAMFTAFISYQLIKNTLSRKYLFIGLLILVYYLLFFIRDMQLMIPSV